MYTTATVTGEIESTTHHWDQEEVRIHTRGSWEGPWKEESGDNLARIGKAMTNAFSRGSYQDTSHNLG